LVETLGTQNDVQRLIPRNVLQAQGHVAGHRVTDDDILTARIGKQLQNGARLDLLEIECQTLARVRRLLVLGCSGLALLLNLDDVLVVGLISELFVVAGRVDGNSGAGANARCVKRADRRTEVAGVVAASQVLREVGIEVNDDLVSNLAQVDMSVWVCQPDHDAASAISAAAKIDATDGALSSRGSGCTARHRRHSAPRARTGVIGAAQ